MGHPELKNINLAMPDFFKVMNLQIKSIPLQDWKIYLRWHVIDSFAPYLSDSFVREDFKMKSALTGVKEQLPRWKRVVGTESQALGFAIGKLFVEEKFSASSKKTVEEMIVRIRDALKNDLQNAAWMNAKTRQAAIQKLDQMEARVGYPDKWWDYSTLEINRDSYVLNVMRASEFLTKRDLNKIGKPVDKNDWDMTPQTINAYYDASMNRLNIPAGILQQPFFDPAASAAINYGGIGFVIGHEMTHGFDDEGAQFDGTGNLKNWWTQDDLKKFQEKTQQIASQFSQYVVNNTVHVQGKLVMGEAAADFGGLTLAWRAFHVPDIYRTVKTIDGFTPDQQFFLSAAHVWASNIRPEEAERLVLVDPHPPAMYRVNGTLANMPEFRATYKISGSSPMINPYCPVIW
jgi:putative endopeptidase